VPATNEAFDAGTTSLGRKLQPASPKHCVIPSHNETILAHSIDRLGSAPLAARPRLRQAPPPPSADATRRFSAARFARLATAWKIGCRARMELGDADKAEKLKIPDARPLPGVALGGYSHVSM
jgi:hypothetical protein